MGSCRAVLLMIMVTVTVRGQGGEVEQSVVGEEAGESDQAREVTVLESATYSMASIGASSIQLRLDRVQGKEKLQMVCSVSPSGPSPLFSRSSCLPTIHLVSGQTSCSSLPDTVDTKPLAELYTTGPGEIEVEATWTDLQGSCVVILRPRECDTEINTDGEEEEQEEDEGEEEGEEVIESAGQNGEVTIPGKRTQKGDSAPASVPVGGVDWSSLQLRRYPRRLQGKAGCLRRPPQVATRAFNPLILAAFTLLSAGTTGAFLVTSSVATSSVYSGIVGTTADPWSTWPLLQLPGLAASTAAYLSLGMMLLYILYGLLTGLPFKFHTVRRRVSSLAARVDPVSVSVPGLLHRPSFVTPLQVLEEVALRIDRGLLRRRTLQTNRRMDMEEHPEYMDSLVEEYPEYMASLIEELENLEDSDY